jgi:nitrate/nitrite transporter NarK
MAVSAREQGAVAGVAGACGPMGFTLGPLIGTALYQIQPEYPYLFTLIVYIPLLIFTLVARVHRVDDTPGE